MKNGLSNALEHVASVHDIPEPPPDDPVPILREWLRQAEQSGGYADPGAMCLATCTAGGAPSARIVLCKSIRESPPALVFFTNYESRKGRELDENPRAAALFHWPHAARQARVEGGVERLSPAESDEYFRSRPYLSRVGAVVSPQSRVIESRGELIAKVAALAARSALGQEIARPAHWGGFVLHMRAVELWSGAKARLHQRVQWLRAAGSERWSWAYLAP